MSILFKVSKILRERPTKVWAYSRQHLLFFITYWLSQFTLRRSSQIHFHHNVRLQRLSSLFAEPSAKIIIGDDTIIYENAIIEAFGSSKISIGAESIIGDARIQSRSQILIGKNLLTSWNVYICDFDPHPVDYNERKIQMKQMVHRFGPSFETTMNKVAFNSDTKVQKTIGFSSSDIVIGDNVWIGANVSILKGAKIGNHCIVATGSVVLKGHYPDKSILAGNPARVVKTLD